jgi:hypothetical protein
MSLNIGLAFALATSITVNIVGGISLNDYRKDNIRLIDDNNKILAQKDYNEKELTRQSKRYSDLMRNRTKLQETVYEQQAEIDQYKGRQATVYAKPGLVERLEKRAMDKFFKEIANDSQK